MESGNFQGSPHACWHVGRCRHVGSLSSSQSAGAGHSPTPALRGSSLLLQLLVFSLGAANRLVQVLLCHGSATPGKAEGEWVPCNTLNIT